MGGVSNPADPGGKGHPPGSGIQASDFSLVQIPTQAETSIPLSCEDQALQELIQLILKDKENVLGKMFDLTSLKLAKSIEENSPNARTLEEAGRDSAEELKERIAKIKTSPDVEKNLASIYSRYGKLIDLKRADQDTEALVKRIENLNYSKKSTRIKNSEVSAYILATSIADPDSDLNDIDAASVWAMEKIRAAAETRDRSYAIGRENGNHLNVSSRVAIYLGNIRGRARLSIEQIEQKLNEEEQAIMKVISGAYVQVKEGLKKCLVEEAKKTQCDTCAQKRLDDFEKKQLDLTEVKRALLKSVGEGEEVTLKKSIVSHYPKKTHLQRKKHKKTVRNEILVPPNIIMERDHTYVAPPVIPIDLRK